MDSQGHPSHPAPGEYAYPRATIGEAWEAMLAFDEHTWGQNHAVGQAHDAEFAWKAEHAHRAAALSYDVWIKSANRLADRIALKSEGPHIAVLNTLGWARSGVVRMEFLPPDPCGHPMCFDSKEKVWKGMAAIGRELARIPLEYAREGCSLVDVETGERVACQIVKLNNPGAAQPYASRRWALGHVNPAHFYEMIFEAKDVSPFGHRLYRVEKATAGEIDARGLRVGAEEIENRHFRLRVDPLRGVVSLVEKETGRELVDASSSFALGEIVGRYALDGRIERQGFSNVRVGMRGPLAASLILEGRAAGCPQRTQEITLYRDSNRIDLATRLLKDELPFWEIYAAFPFAVKPPRFMFEGTLSVTEPLVDQLPGTSSDAYAIQQWADVSTEAGEWGVTLSSREAAITLFGGIWPGYVSPSHHGVAPPGFNHPFLKPGEFREGHIYSYLMSGNFRTNFMPTQSEDVLFRHSFAPHAGDWRAGGAVRFGCESHAPLEAVPLTGPREGAWGPAESLAQVEPANVLLLSIKRAEDGRGLILRLFETEGRETEARVTLPWMMIREARGCDGVERDGEALRVEGGCVRIEVGRFGVATVRVKGVVAE